VFISVVIKCHFPIQQADQKTTEVDSPYGFTITNYTKNCYKNKNNKLSRSFLYYSKLQINLNAIKLKQMIYLQIIKVY